MVNRISTDTTRKPQPPSNRNTSQLRTASAKTVYVDDIITSLANAHENRRARQVTEWQRVAAQTFRMAV
ncbi:MAG: hypothetical protein ACJ73D_00430 [Pyrinomonadaceae bacterium]